VPWKKGLPAILAALLLIANHCTGLPLLEASSAPKTLRIGSNSGVYWTAPWCGIWHNCGRDTAPSWSQPQLTQLQRSPKRRRTGNVISSLNLKKTNTDDENESLWDTSDSSMGTSWNAALRQTMAGIAGLGAIETAYLTYAHFTTTALYCAASSLSSETSSCNSVLQGPYAVIPGTDVPLAAIGCLAYTTVAILAIGPSWLFPLVSGGQRGSDNVDDSIRRVMLTTLTTSMAVFSLCLLFILSFILHESCPYCLGSAALSLTLATLAWFGNSSAKGPTDSQTWTASVAASLSTVAAAAVLVSSVATNSPNSLATEAATRSAVNFAGELVPSAVSSSLVASTSSSPSGMLAAAMVDKKPPLVILQSPPAITTESSETALQLAQELQALNAKFYGAFWCSHCYDQKQAFGKEAMGRIPYVECSKDGVDAQVALCKEKKVPGYPTWEIAGQLYPGEQALEELQTIVTNAKVAAKTKS
jgi:uncharacterized membrane protein